MNFRIRQNDTLPHITVRISQGGLPLPLSDCTVTMNLYEQGRSAPVMSKTCTVTTPMDGVAEYAWLPADTATVRKLRAEFVVTYLDGNRLTVPEHDWVSVEIVAHSGDLR